MSQASELPVGESPIDDLSINTLPLQEWPAYKALRLEALRTEPQAYCTTFADMEVKPDEYWQDRLAATHAGGLPHMLFARKSSQLVGIIAAYLEEPGHATVISVYVTKAERGRGVGRKLMEAILAKIEEDPAIKKVSLKVNAEQVAAVALYTAMGFEAVGSGRTPMGDGEVHVQIVMERR